MLGDFLQKLRQNEPTKVWVFRRFIIVLSIILLGAVLTTLCIGVRDELPSIKTTLTAVNNIPMPDASFFFNINFSVTCLIFNSTDGSSIQNVNECTSKNIIQTENYGGTYIGKFLPQNISFDGNRELRIFLTSPTAEPTNDHRISVRAFDPEFSAYRIVDFDKLQDTFVREIGYKNFFLLTEAAGGLSEYQWRYSRHKRKSLIDGYLSYIGFGTNYIERPYIDSDIQFIPHPEVPLNNSDSRITISVVPRGFIVTEETEQRSKTITAVLGAIGGIWGIVLSFYVLLFGTELISPWGLVQKSLKLKPFEEFEKDSQLGVEDGETNDLEKRVKELEKIVQFYGEYVITIPSATKKSQYKFCCW